MRSSMDAEIDKQQHFIKNPLEIASKLTPTAILLVLIILAQQRVEANPNAISTQLRYPQRSNRYNSYGWNANSQYCYNDDDIHLLQKIQIEHLSLSDPAATEKFFTLKEDKKFYENWVCTRPLLNTLLNRLDRDSYTLPNREAKDSQLHPLWNYADRLARQIANWQSERTKNQNIDLMNDPVMLVFEELKDWFFNILSKKLCHKDEWELIARRQSYIKSLIHMIPNFGPDRLYLHEIQQSLEDAAKIIFSCTANKELPKFLSELIITGKSLENTIGTYLHFLMIDEEVADNFSPAHLDGGDRNCESSPVCKIYRAIAMQHSSSELTPYDVLNHFYDVASSDENPTGRLNIQIKSSLTDSIRFASFATHRDKKNYGEATAILDALIRVRKVLDEFQDILPRIGTYMYAVNYLEKVDLLATNYINLINKVKLLMQNLIQSADEGLNSVLQQHLKPHQRDFYFEKNIRSLETRVAKGTTVTALLENFCIKAIESMQKYQQEMRKLVRSVNSGDASYEVGHAMDSIFLQIKKLNVILPGMLGERFLPLEQAHDEAQATVVTHSQERIAYVEQRSDVSSVTHIQNLLKSHSAPEPLFQQTFDHPMLTKNDFCEQNKIPQHIYGIAGAGSILLFGSLAITQLRKLSLFKPQKDTPPKEHRKFKKHADKKQREVQTISAKRS